MILKLFSLFGFPFEGFKFKNLIQENSHGCHSYWDIYNLRFGTFSVYVKHVGIWCYLFLQRVTFLNDYVSAHPHQTFC